MESWRGKEIEVLAYFIWERSARVEGRSLDHWLEAEYLVRTSSFVPEENNINLVRQETNTPLLSS